MHLRQICLVAEKLAPAIDDLAAVFGLEVCYVDPGVATFGLENSLLPVGRGFLEVVAPVRPDTAAGRYLTRRGGNGGYMVICQCETQEEQAAHRARAAALGVRVAWEMEHDGYFGMQLHPRDTGGAFFEIDWDVRAQSEGHWQPAGGTDWTRAIHTDVVRGFHAAELQSPDPQKLAERWGRIADVPLVPDAQGQPTLSLDNATLRFVEARDGRGEGLGGLDLDVADPTRLLAEADKRGLRVADDRVDICGTRFYLR